MSRRSILKYLSVGLVLAVLVSLEFLYEYTRGDAPDAALCLTPQSRQDAIKDVLLQHGY
jgi:hypothetical protein